MGVGVFPAGNGSKGLLNPTKVFSLLLDGLGLGFAVAGGAHGMGKRLDEFEFLGIAHVVDGLAQVLAKLVVHVLSVPWGGRGSQTVSFFGLPWKALESGEIAGKQAGARIPSRTQCRGESFPATWQDRNPATVRAR